MPRAALYGILHSENAMLRGILLSDSTYRVVLERVRLGGKPRAPPVS